MTSVIRFEDSRRRMVRSSRIDTCFGLKLECRAFRASSIKACLRFFLSSEATAQNRAGESCSSRLVRGT